MMKNKHDIVTRTMHTCSELHVREAAGDESPSRVITGYAILFNTPSAPLWSDEDSEAREIITADAVTPELLANSDIKMTMFHDQQLILARSNKGEGTLSYEIDEKGVKFEFEAPKTADGDKAIELVRRGDISGCSFAFVTKYWDEAFVENSANIVDGRTIITYRVKVMIGIYDFTLAADPAYPDTSVEAREFVTQLREKKEPRETANREKVKEQIREMRTAAKSKL